jgi:two-component system, LytTR family, response regulator
MSLHTALIVDDERIARRELAYLLREHPEIEVGGEAASVQEAADAVGRLHPALIFLDVQMPGASGFDLIRAGNATGQIVFVTAYAEFALQAFDVDALDYLTKPVRPERLRQTIDRFLQRARAEQPTTPRLSMGEPILLTTGRSTVLVRVASIACILAEGDYTRVVTADGVTGIILKSMREWERILPEADFCRIQRSAIINCGQASRFEPALNGGYAIHMKHLREPLVMSRRFARRFRARFGL